jgi:DNA-binding winged helix-turn-helix (wHTH) protein/tetratricopeptide (TPR) repeat protein
MLSAMKAVRYRFDDFVLDAAARELWRDGERVAIPPKSLECLAYLMQHHGRAVGRDELIAAVWGRVDASDTLLTQTIWRARKAIGDEGDKCLRTVPRFGYRWVAPVRVEAVTNEEVAEPAEPIVEPVNKVMTPIRPPRRRLAFAALALGLAIVASGLWLHRGTNVLPEARVVPSLVVVLPVSVADASPESTWIRLGAMDYVASRLRDAKLNVLPSERVVAIAKSASGAPDADERARVASLTSADYLLVPRADFAGGSWHFSIDAYHDGRARTYRAEASAALPAADDAAARFLDDTGHAALAATARPDATSELLQRLDAALLEGDLAKARSILDAADHGVRADPRVLARAGKIAFRAGRLDEADAAFTPLVAADAGVPANLRVLGDMGLGGVAIRRHDFEAANRHYTAAIDTLGVAGDTALLGRAYTERAVVEGSLNRVDLAVADVARARAALERSGDPIGLAGLDLNGAIIETQRGHYDDATRMFDRAADVYGRVDIADQLAIALAGRTDTRLTVLDAAGAVAGSSRAWNLLPRLEDPLLIQFLGARHVAALRANGRLAEAARVLDRFAPTGDHASRDPAFGVLRAAVLVDQDKAPLALRLADSILADFEAAPVGSCSDTVPRAAIVLAEAAVQSRDPAAAKPLLARLSEFASSPQDPEWTFAQDLASAQLLDAVGDAEADRRFAAALAFADGTGEPSRIVEASAAYASYAVERSDRVRAESLLKRLVPYVAIDYRAARAAALLHGVLGETSNAESAAAEARRLAGERAPGLREPQAVAIRSGGTH